MGGEDTATEVAQAAAINGSSSPGNPSGPVALDNDKVNDTNAMDEEVKDDAKLETEEMDEDPKIKDEINTKEVDDDTEEGAVAEPEGKGVVEEEKVSQETLEEMQNKEALQHEETKEDAEKEKREPQVEAMEQDSESAEKEVGEKGTSDGKEQEKFVMSTKDEEDERMKKEKKEEDECMREDKEGEDEVKEEKEEAEEMNEDKEEEEKIKEEKGSNNHRKGKSARGKGEDKAKSVKTKKVLEPKTPVTPAIDRPVRERKSVERLVAIIEKDSSKDFHVEKGRGTALKDIPNVAYKLSRKKSDETFKLLHTILFGRRGKAFQIKNNISRFSGFVWHDNEDKQKMKAKEKLDKCNKEKLLEFCDVLDIPISKATTRKEDIITKLIEFMLAPHATTDVLLVEKDLSSKGKRKRVTKPSSSGGTPRSTKSRRKVTDTSKSKDRKYTSGTEGESEEEEEDETNEESEKEKENGVHSRTLDGSSEQSASEEKDSESDEDSDDTKKHQHISKKSSAKKASARRTKSDKTIAPKKSSQPPKSAPKKSVSNRKKVDYDSDSSPKVSSKKKEKSATLKPPTPSKAATPSKSETKEKAGRKVSKGKEKLKPSDKVLRAEICKILKEVDFNTATFTDILKQLAKKFETDLTSRKSSIKLIIQEELTKLADEPDEEEEGEGEAEGTQSGQEVRG